MKKSIDGFTIVELLIVIVVIAILAAITVVAYNGIQVRARDSQRSQDIASIKKALLLYSVDNGGVPRTYTYSGAGPGGWNLSSMSSWLSFLAPSYPKIPVDPTNTGTADPSAYELSYYYYCYTAGTGGYTNPTAVLGYWAEATHANIRVIFTVDQCI